MQIYNLSQASPPWLLFGLNSTPILGRLLCTSSGSSDQDDTVHVAHEYINNNNDK